MIGVSLRLAQFEKHRQQHILSLAHAVAQLLIVIKPVHRFQQQCIQWRRLYRGWQAFRIAHFSSGDTACRHAGIGYRWGCSFRRILLAQQFGNFVYVGESRVNLRFKEKCGVADCLGVPRRQNIDHFCVDLARPRPAPKVGNTLIVDGDHRHLVTWYAR
ncbi:MAG: hypothetical protein ACD_23C00646G0001 [uncultured bacterium]|nr:MAG: hypothetical protein ACD_23C00646G0001 [uncultured bacterium]